MLQRQIMFKQLQELQRSQQLQELADPRNQDYINQLTSLKQASSLQFSSTVNGEPLRDSQMFAMGNMQMMQHGGSGVFQGFPNGLVVSQGQNHGLGLSTPQFDDSCYGFSAHLNLFSQFQGLSNQSDNVLAKNNSRSVGISAMHPSGFANSFSSQQGNFTSDHNSMPDGGLLPNQIFQQNNFFGQIPVQSLNNGLSENYAGQKLRIPRHEDTGWHGNSPGKTSNVAMSATDATLDPLERQILYDTDDSNLGLSYGGSQLGKRGFETKVDNASYIDTLSSSQSGSWSALMQSAVAETSSSDNGIQEDWSGLSFNNIDRSPDNRPLTLLGIEKLQSNWVDRNLQCVPLPSSEFQKDDINFPGFQQSRHQYPKQQDEFQPNASHTFSKQSQQKHPIGGSQLFQTTSIALPSQGDEVRGSLWLHRSTSNSASGGIQNLFDQENQLSAYRFSVEPQKLISGGNDVSLPTLMASSDFHGQNATAQSKSMVELHKDDISNDELQLKARVTYSSMGNSGLTSIQSSYVNDYIKNQTSRSHMTTKFPEHSVASSQVNFKPSGPSVESQHAVFSSESPIHSPHGTSQQDLPSPRSHKFSTNLIQSSDSASSRRESKSGPPNEQLLEKEKSLNSVEMHNLIPSTNSISQRPSYQRGITEDEMPALSTGDIRALDQNLNQDNYVHSQRSGTELGKMLPTRYDGLHYQQAFANARELLLSRQKLSMKEKVKSKSELGSFTGGDHIGWNFPPEAQGDHSGKASAASAADVQNYQKIEMLRQSDARSCSPGVNDASNGAYSPQISLQMAPTWFKNHGTLNYQMLPMYNPDITINAPQQFTQLNTGHLLENNTIMLGNPSNTSQRSGVWPASASTLLASGHLSPNNMSSSDAANQNSDVSLSKKRKVHTFDLVPWHKEVNHEAPRLQNMSISEVEWAQASSRRQEEAKSGAEIVDELPVIQPKRRLVFTTQLIQQVFGPAPAVILFADATWNCDSVAYFASRLALGDACSLISKQLSDTDLTARGAAEASSSPAEGALYSSPYYDVPAKKLKVPKRTNKCDFSKIAEGLTSRVKKLEGELSRLEKSLSMVDVKVENQELEKFSIINRFAKFHMKAQLITADQASASGPSSGPRNHLQRYVMANPMPKTIPEDFDCLPL